jgi:hypothetical protein
MLDDVREALDLWPLMHEQRRAEAARDDAPLMATTDGWAVLSVRERLSRVVSAKTAENRAKGVCAARHR